MDEFLTLNLKIPAYLSVKELSPGMELIHKVIPGDNSFTDKYAGIFRFKVRNSSTRLYLETTPSLTSMLVSSGSR